MKYSQILNLHKTLIIWDPESVACHKTQTEGSVKEVAAAGVLAVQIKHAFQISASGGKLSGQPGDDLIKNEANKYVDYPDDV